MILGSGIALGVFVPALSLKLQLESEGHRADLLCVEELYSGKDDVMEETRKSELAMVRSNGLIYDEEKQTAIGEYAKETDKITKDIFAELLIDQAYCFAGAYMLKRDLLFECYPSKQIPESNEGQNLQLLVPPASRSLCGFLDEKLHTYRRHAGSHSLKCRSYQEVLGRIKNFTALKKEILNFCDCDRNEYEKLIEENEEKSIRELMKETIKKARNKTE